jgi:hypothetical protein
MPAAFRFEKANAEHIGDLKMNSQGFHVYWWPKSISSQTSTKILGRLNSLNSAEELASVVATYAGRRVLSIRIAQRIFGIKEQLGRFQDLRQVAAVPGIGTKRFTSIINALNGHL